MNAAFQRHVNELASAQVPVEFARMKVGVGEKNIQQGIVVEVHYGDSTRLTSLKPHGIESEINPRELGTFQVRRQLTQ